MWRRVTGWCPLFRDSVIASSSVPEKSNAVSLLGLSILEYKTIAPSRNVRFQSPVTKRHIPSRKDGDLNCTATIARNPQTGKANRCTCAIFRRKHAIRQRYVYDWHYQYTNSLHVQTHCLSTYLRVLAQDFYSSSPPPPPPVIQNPEHRNQ
jgi:hypothetical protein